jgi:hypothetical protein
MAAQGTEREVDMVQVVVGVEKTLDTRDVKVEALKE